MKIILLFFLSVSSIVLNAQKDSTFVHNVQYEYNIHSLVPGFLHQLSDSTYLTIMYLDKGSPPPYYIRYNRKGKPIEKGRLSLPSIGNQVSDMLFTSDDGLLYMSRGDNYPFAIKFDKNMNEQWRIFSDNTDLKNPKKMVIREATEINGKIYGMAADSSVNTMIFKLNLTTGDTIAIKPVQDYCTSCKTLGAELARSIEGKLHFRLFDNNYYKWNYMTVVDTKLNAISFDTIGFYTNAKPTSLVFQPNPNLLVSFTDSIRKKDGLTLFNLYNVQTRKGKGIKTNLKFFGALIQANDFMDTEGNFYFHFIIDGPKQNKRDVHVVYKIDGNGNLLREYILAFEKNGDIKTTFYIHELMATKQGGFAFYMQENVSFSKPPQYLVVTDSNFNVNGKPFYSQFVQTSILENNSFSSLSIYPNPTSSTLTISNNNQNLTYTLLDLNGRKVLWGSLQKNQNKTVLDLSELKRGMYFLRFHNLENGFTETRKVIVGR